MSSHPQQPITCLALGRFIQTKDHEVRRMKDYKAILERVESTFIRIDLVNFSADRICIIPDEFKYLEGKAFSDIDHSLPSRQGSCCDG